MSPRIETERLILRPPAIEDFPRWAEMMADEETARFIGGVTPASVVWRQMMTMAGSWSLLGYAMFSMIDKDTGRWLGRVGPWTPHGWPGTEVGWSVHPDAAGQGYAAEAAVAAIEWAFDTLGWTDVIHCIDPANRPSQKLAERMGSRVLRMDRMPPPYDGMEIEVWGQSRDEWRARRAAA